MNDRPTPETKSFYVTAFDVEEWAEKCIRLEKERDEAREKLSATWQSLRDSQDEILRLTFENREISQELDKARDTIMKIEEIFIDSEDMHDDWMKVGNIARTFCEKYI